MTTPPGGVLHGRYELRRRLDTGGMGTVWEAFDTILARRVAAKALIPEVNYGADLQDMRERMRREALALALVDHPAVVTVHDLIYDSEDPWIVMGYVDGPTLARYVTSRRIPEQEIASIGLVILEGLLACHAKDVCHRDVKPANIIRTPEGSARLVDFGIARISTMQTLTPTSKVIGTPEFMAPELLKNNRAASQRTDLWSLGATLYYALEGRSPFAKPTLVETLAAIGSQEPPSPPRRQGPLARLVLRMLRKEPSERPDAGTVLSELRKIAGSGASQARPVWEEKPPAGPKPVPTVRLNGSVKEYPPPPKPPAKLGDTWVRPPAKPLTWLSGKPDDEAAKLIAGLPSHRAIADLLALEDAEAARVILRCDSTVAGRLLSLAAVDRPAWTRKIIEMMTAARAGQLLDKMTAAASAAALALPPAQGAARVLSRTDDATVKAVLSELAKQRPGRGAPLVLALDDLEAGRVAQVLGRSEPLIVARLLHNVSTSSRRESLLSRLPWQFRQLVEKHLATMTNTD